MIGRKLVFAFSMLYVGLNVSSVGRLFSQQQDQYSSLVAQAKSDLNSGNAGKAQEEAQRAELLNPKPWEAFLIAGAAQESMNQHSSAAMTFTNALIDAPEDKKAAIRDLIEKCTKEGIASTPPATPPERGVSANGRGNLAETMQFIQDQLRSRGELQYNYQAGPNAPAMYHADSGNQHTESMANTMADPNSCSLRTSANSPSISLMDVSAVLVKGITAIFPGDTITPGVFIVELRTNGSTFDDISGDLPPLYLYSILQQTEPQFLRSLAPRQGHLVMHTIGYLFGEKNVADQVGQAFLHASQLCQGTGTTSSPSLAQIGSSVSVSRNDASRNGPSLADTMRFIEEKMDEQGDVSWTSPGINGWGAGQIVILRISDVVADPASCTFQATVGESYDPPQWRYFASFKDIENISVAQNVGSTYFLSINAEGELFKRHPLNLPPEFAANAKGKMVKNPNYTGMSDGEQNRPEIDLPFREQQLANRVAQAMQHAAELCGAGNKHEPF